ncbi:MAG: DMT family transporter [Acetobacteraceae bacterium]|nr:MAG: DMT family transporter [Acetobacteraceae bacterium]
MLALGFGLTAALIWAVHDLLARKLSQGAALLPIIATVLFTGCVALAPIALIWGDWAAMTATAVGISITYGLAYAVAGGALYKAFSVAPVRLVSPVIGAYPMLSLLIAWAQGQPVTPADWLAVAAIIAGITVVATAARSDSPEGYDASPGVALGWAALSALGFATTFALGQEATRQGAELPAMLIGRGVALLAIVALALTRKVSLRPLRGQGWLLALMGTFDAVALGLVTAAGALPRAEYASVTSSLFGVLTVLLAAWVLREQVRYVQWLGIACVFTGIALLGLQH